MNQEMAMWGNKNILDNYDLYLEYEKRQRRRSEEELESLYEPEFLEDIERDEKYLEYLRELEEDRVGGQKSGKV